MSIVTVGIDLAKNVFALHGVDQSDKAVFSKPKVVRGQLLEMVASLPPRLIGMEACAGTHHWAKEFSRFGHTVKLMAPKFVAPKTTKVGTGSRLCRLHEEANKLKRESVNCDMTPSVK